jgi:hypothetical protein
MHPNDVRGTGGASKNQSCPRADEPEYWLLLTEEQAVDICSGFVPNAVKARVLGLLDHQRELERCAARPVKGKQG